MRFAHLLLALSLLGPAWAQPGQAPRNLSITQPSGALAESQLDLRWDPVVGAVGYEVLRKVNGRWWLNEDDPNCIPITNSTSITGLASGTDFEFCVRAVLAGGVSPNGQVVKAHTNAAGAASTSRPSTTPLKLPDVPDPDAQMPKTHGATDPDPVPEGASITDLLPPPSKRRVSAPPPQTSPPPTRPAEPDPVATSGSITDLVPPPPRPKAVVPKEQPKGPPPPIPEGLMGFYSSQSEIRLSWRAVREATGYQIEEEKEGKWVLLDDGILEENRPSFVLKNRGAGPYLFRVRAVRYGVRSSYSLPTKVER